MDDERREHQACLEDGTDEEQHTPKEMTIFSLPLKVYTYEELAMRDSNYDSGVIYTWMATGKTSWLQRGVWRRVPSARGYVVLGSRITVAPASKQAACTGAGCQCQQAVAANKE